MYYQFYLNKREVLQNHDCLPQALPLALFHSSLNETLSWTEFKVEDKTVVSKIQNTKIEWIYN
jgi:hypothetical protein